MNRDVSCIEVFRTPGIAGGVLIHVADSCQAAREQEVGHAALFGARK